MTKREKRLAALATLTTGAVLVASLVLTAKIQNFEKQAAEPDPVIKASVVRALAEPENVELTHVPEIETEGPESLGMFKLTAYCACPKCCGEWADGITYTGTKATEGRTVAVDPDVIPLGSSVYINGHEYVAEDIGGAIKGGRVDIFFNSHADALDFGVQYAEVKID